MTTSLYYGESVKQNLCPQNTAKDLNYHAGHFCILQSVKSSVRQQWLNAVLVTLQYKVAYTWWGIVLKVRARIVGIVVKINI